MKTRKPGRAVTRTTEHTQTVTRQVIEETLWRIPSEKLKPVEEE